VEVPAAHLDDLSLPAGLGEGRQGSLQHLAGVAVLLGTAVEGEDFHGGSPDSNLADRRLVNSALRIQNPYSKFRFEVPS